MDFFANQDSARRKTKYLVVVFLLAVVIITGVASAVLCFCLWVFNFNSSNNFPPLSEYFKWEVFGWVSLVVNSIILLAILYKWYSISDGGRSVAELLGGKLIQPNTRDPQERMLLNVVEEMALASGMPVPLVYLLEQERGLNAFAAGYSPADAVIGITRGSLKTFNREQLQGVVAHEFSHILNGDMRLNMRLMALLYGILFLGHCGNYILRKSRLTTYSSGGRAISGRLILLGLVLAAIGGLGMFFGGLIKAAINRQREYLADASAVQFTRNPQSIGNALKIIGGYSSGSRILAGNVDEASHMYLSNGLGSLAFFKTHPPLEERIKRIEPRWDGEMIKISPKPKPQVSENKAMHPSGSVAAAAILATVLDPTGNPEASSETVALNAEKVLEKLRDPFTAASAIFALLLDEKPEVRNRQLRVIQQSGAKGADSMSKQLFEELAQLPQSYRLIVIEKGMPALKCMSKKQYITFRKIIKTLIHGDKKIDLFEWCLFQLMRHYLGSEYGDQRKSQARYKTINEIGEHYALVVSTIIYHCHLDPDTVDRAFTRGINTAGLYTAKRIPEEQCTVEKFMEGVNAMADCYPLLKARILKGLTHVIEFDKKVTSTEKELITAIAAAMDSPLPRVKQGG